MLRSQGNQDLKQIPIGLSANSSCVSVHILCCYVLYISPMWDSVKESFHKRTTSSKKSSLKIVESQNSGKLTECADNGMIQMR